MALIKFLFMHVTCTLIQEIGKQAAHDSLMTDDQNIALSLQLHDDWLQPLNQILVGLEIEQIHGKSNDTELVFFFFFFDFQVHSVFIKNTSVSKSACINLSCPYGFRLSYLFVKNSTLLLTQYNLATIMINILFTASACLQ